VIVNLLLHLSFVGSLYVFYFFFGDELVDVILFCFSYVCVRLMPAYVCVVYVNHTTISYSVCVRGEEEERRVELCVSEMQKTHAKTRTREPPGDP